MARGDGRAVSNSADTFSPDIVTGRQEPRIHPLVPPGTDTQLFVNGQAISGNEDVFAFPAPWVSNDTLIYASNGKSGAEDVVSGAVTAVPFSAQVSFSRQSYPLKSHDSTRRKRGP